MTDLFAISMNGTNASTDPFSDVVWQQNVPYIAIPVPWTLLLVQAFFTAIVNSYLDSKTLLSRTIMDRANKLLYILLLLFALITSVVCTLFYLFSDSGHVLSLVAGWPFVYLAHTTILELVLNTLIQLVLIRHIKFEKSSLAM